MVSCLVLKSTSLFSAWMCSNQSCMLACDATGLASLHCWGAIYFL